MTAVPPSLEQRLAASDYKGARFQGRDAGVSESRWALTFSLCSALRNETVLHQFCCPAADAEQKPACSDLASPRWALTGGRPPSCPTSCPSEQSAGHHAIGPLPLESRFFVCFSSFLHLYFSFLPLDP